MMMSRRERARRIAQRRVGRWRPRELASGSVGGVRGSGGVSLISAVMNSMSGFGGGDDVADIVVEVRTNDLNMSNEKERYKESDLTGA